MFAQFVQFFLQYEYWFAASQLTLAMLGMGATLQVKDFVNIVKMPKALINGLVVQTFIVALVAFVIIYLSQPVVGVTIGIALCAAVPGGTTSNIFTHLGKGNSALSVSMTTVSSIACLLTAPLILHVLIAQHMPADFEMPSAVIARDICFNLLVPLVLGMLLLKHLPNIAHGFSKWCIRLSLLVIAAIVVGASGAGRLDLEAYGMANVLLVVGFMLVLMLFSWFTPALAKLPTPDSVAICMEVTVRNINLALLVHVALFSLGKVDSLIANQAMLTLLLYGALQMLLCLPLITVGRVSYSRRLALAKP